jgi:hypothetical protein
MKVKTNLKAGTGLPDLADKFKDFFLWFIDLIDIFGIFGKA